MALKFDMSKGDWQRDYMMQQQMNQGVNPYRELGENIATGAGLLGKAAFPEGGRKIMKKLPNWFKAKGTPDIDAYKTDKEKWDEEARLAKGGIDWSIYDKELLKQPGAKMNILKKAGLRDRPMQKDFMGDSKYKFTPFQGMKNIGETILPEGGQKYKDIVAPKGGKNILRNLGYGVAGAGAATISPFLGGAAGLYGMANLQGPIKGAIAKEKARKEAAKLKDIERQKEGRRIHQERLAQAVESKRLRPPTPLSEDDDEFEDIPYEGFEGYKPETYKDWETPERPEREGIPEELAKIPLSKKELRKQRRKEKGGPLQRLFGKKTREPVEEVPEVTDEIPEEKGTPRYLNLIREERERGQREQKEQKNKDKYNTIKESIDAGTFDFKDVERVAPEGFEDYSIPEEISPELQDKLDKEESIFEYDEGDEGQKEIDKLIDTEVSKEGKSDKAYEEINFKDYGFNSYNDMMTGYKKAQEYYKLKGKELSIDQYLQVQAIKDMDLPF